MKNLNQKLENLSQKLEVLSQEFPGEFLKISNMLDTVYQQIVKKSPSFKAIGKMYEDTVFTKNYINFCNDVSKIQDATFFKELLGLKKANTNLNSFSYSIVKDKAYEELSNHIFISKDMNTTYLIKTIKLIAKALDINIEFYNI